jgi:hypothetical protein
VAVTVFVRVDVVQLYATTVRVEVGNVIVTLTCAIPNTIVTGLGVLGTVVSRLNQRLCEGQGSQCLRRYCRRFGDIKDRGGCLPKSARLSIDCESPHPCECVALHDNYPVTGIHVLLKDLIARDIASTVSDLSICPPEGSLTMWGLDGHYQKHTRYPNKNSRFRLVGVNKYRRDAALVRVTSYEI